MISQQIVGVLLDMHKKPIDGNMESKAKQSKNDSFVDCLKSRIGKQTIFSQQETKNFDNQLAPTIHDFGVLLDIHKKM